MDRAVQIRRARLGREVVHLVVQKHASAFRDNAGAEPAVQRVGIRDRVSARIDDSEVRRLRRFVTGRLARGDFTAGRSAIEFDRAPLPFGIGFVDQARDRNLYEIGVAEIFRPVGVSAPHRFDQEMVIVRRKRL